MNYISSIALYFLFFYVLAIWRRMRLRMNDESQTVRREAVEILNEETHLSPELTQPVLLSDFYSRGMHPVARLIKLQDKTLLSNNK
jgi:hypothetical protein